MRKYLLALAISCVVSPAMAAGDMLDGTWLTGDGSSKVQFQPCPKGVCGRIAWLRDPLDPKTGKPWLDAQNEDAGLRSRPLLGLSITEGLQQDGAKTYRTTFYNPLDGHSYRDTIRDLGNGRLELEGCALAGLLCQRETWTRVKG